MPKILSYIFLITVLFCGQQRVFAQNTYLVFLKDKQSLSNQNQVVQLSDRSIKRRAINQVVMDDKDMLVSDMYLQELIEFGNVINSSRWLNAVMFTTDLTALEMEERFGFISSIEKVSFEKNNKIIKNQLNSAKSLDYGPAGQQINQINVNCLHDQGFLGNDIYLAVIDAGFENMNSINYFDSLYMNNRVLDEYNFLDNSSNVYGLSGHGTAVSSCIVAHKPFPFEYVGTAIGADLALYISEDVGSETLVEEFNLVLALERCDSVGVNIANISLGYFEFDDSTTNHVYADLDGATTIAAMGVNVAFSKGIFVVTSAGNSGPSTISTPCDANDVLCVGALNENGDHAWFSSVGPAADGSVKPNVAARGEDTWFINADGDRVQGNGTSFSSPIVAGAVACLMEAHPTKTVQQMKQAIEQSAHQFNSPDIYRGYGIPDFCIASDLLEVMSIKEQERSMLVSVYPNPSFGSICIHDETGIFSNEDVLLSVCNVLGKKLIEQHFLFTNGDILIDLSNFQAGVYFVLLQSKGLDVRKTLVVK